MTRINALNPTTPQDLNQITRMIYQKEEHAEKIIRTTCDYFLAQRVKPELFKTRAEYAEALILHHELIVAAMKAKQSVDVKTSDNLK